MQWLNKENRMYNFTNYTRNRKFNIVYEKKTTSIYECMLIKCVNPDKNML